MAFGGYKFKGYKVVRANLTNNTYANWCLLVHQARIKAFMESCALSGAQWHFSKTNGALSFESYGNVIYRVANANGEYHDYLSFFKYGDEELYYMISTLGEYYWQGGTPEITHASQYQEQGGSTTAGKYKFAGYSSALSLQPFGDGGPFYFSDNSNSYPDHALPCTSQMCGASTNYYTNGVQENTSGFSPSASIGQKVGYATKGKDIITIAPNNKGCVESGDAFASLCDPDDTYALAKIPLGAHVGETESYTPINNVSLDFWTGECLDASGKRSSKNTSASASSKNNLAVIPDVNSYFSPGGTKVPFGSVSLGTTGAFNNLVSLNSNSIFTKGVIKPELLCCNSYYSETKSQQPAIGSTVLGGNLLALCACQRVPTDALNPSRGRIHAGYTVPGTGFTESYAICFCFPVAYVGWDPSNPDITNESSWPELALQ